MIIPIKESGLLKNTLSEELYNGGKISGTAVNNSCNMSSMGLYH